MSSSSPLHEDARPRDTVIAVDVYTLSLEEGARWVNKVQASSSSSTRTFDSQSHSTARLTITLVQINIEPFLTLERHIPIYIIVHAKEQTTMIEPDSTPPPPPIQRPRRIIIAGYILSLEQGALWANKIRNDTIPATLRFSPTVLEIIDEDFRKQGGIAVYYNIGDTARETATTRYIVTTQMKRGYWMNTNQETVEREQVRDPEIRLVEGEADRRVLERLIENGINPTRFDCHFF